MTQPLRQTGHRARVPAAAVFLRSRHIVIQFSSSEPVPREQAFEREALPWIDDVFRFALSLTRDEADADDIVQDTFLRAYRSWHTFLPGSDCRRWLFTICRNVFLRSRERQPLTVEIDESECEAIAASDAFHGAGRDGADELHARIDLKTAIEKALTRLPEPFHSTLMLVDLEDQSYETAAEILGVPIGTVRSRLFRGRRLMQEHLLAHARDAGIGYEVRAAS